MALHGAENSVLVLHNYVDEDQGDEDDPGDGDDNDDEDDDGEDEDGEIGDGDVEKESCEERGNNNEDDICEKNNDGKRTRNRNYSACRPDGSQKV